MGNARNRPKAPTQVVYIPQPVYQTPTSGTGGTGNDNPAGGGTESPPTPEQQRENNLLGRNRSRLGTILTGFRGLLSPVETDTPRKTLLGE